ncbi:uracil-DNA glycosylase [Sphaerotilus hippei]|uniref:Uracil-DNA glycosylase n=1 Tax=Sphaerotilus hippei TaxID=744406 RepID=A0A318GUI1_9BURK|nr:uracil-DNA glycosylase [Sphaerotilus hippei]
MNGGLFEVAPGNRLASPLAAVFDAAAPAWADVVGRFAASPVGQALARRIDERVARGVVVFPDRPLRALEGLPPSQVKVVILGQDPYHGPGEAEGLAFSVAPGVRVPPSLRNIRQELQADLGVAAPASGSLLPWVAQGVLLLNTSLTVEQDQPASHARWGWSELTDALVERVARDPVPKVFMLWGAHAQAKRALIDQAGQGGHLCLQSNHPSPLAARRAPVPFLGSRPFSAANAFLCSAGRAPVDWAL